jgi:hypothetical protein
MIKGANIDKDMDTNRKVGTSCKQKGILDSSG